MVNLKTVFLLIVCLLFTLFGFSQSPTVTVSGIVQDQKTKLALPFVNVIIKKTSDSSFYAGTITDENGRFVLSKVKEGNYLLIASYIGYRPNTQLILVGHLSEFLDLSFVELIEDSADLSEVVVSSKKDEIEAKMDKKTFNAEENLSQVGGTILQMLKNLPGITIDQDGNVLLRGSNKIIFLIDGQQTTLKASDLDNMPASAIDKIEIINNPSAKYDANGNAGIINFIFKKNKQEGFNGKIGFAGGFGALWIKKENYPGIRPQYQATPKINPSISLNYRKKKINTFFQGDFLYNPTLNKNEFVDRYYDNGKIIKQQTKRNRNTTVVTTKAGTDWNINKNNSLTVSGFYMWEKIIDNGDEPFFNDQLTDRMRLWQFLEDEIKITAIASSAFQHKFAQPGRVLNMGFLYTFHREDEKYFFTNIMPTFTGKDAFALISDEHVGDFYMDYIKPLKHGKFETGLKFRRRVIPTNMKFIPGLNSPLDTNAEGWADYKETIPALYGNYILENTKFELEAGLRLEYVNLNYEVNPNHNTYKSDGYNYAQPFPNLRLAYKINDHNRLGFFYNRRVDRPNEVDIRIFPKYDDPELLKIGNPALKPMFTNSFELGFKTSMKKGYFYSALFHRISNGTITRIGSIVPGQTIIYSIFQNAEMAYMSGVELVFARTSTKWFSYNFNVTAYQNIIDGFTVINKYPIQNSFTAPRQQIISGNAKGNAIFKFKNNLDMLVTIVYMAPDIIPQGKIDSRYAMDLGIKKSIQKGKGELFLNATDVFNTMRIKKEINGAGFYYKSTDFYETQVFRLGYNYKF
jgi:outer membrane receptor protein involved in Fe transport